MEISALNSTFSQNLPLTKATTIGLLAAGVILYSLFRKKSGLENLVFYPHSIKDIYFDGITPVMTIGLAVQNTSNQSFTLRSLAGYVYANDMQIGNVSVFQPQTIAPNSQTVVYVNARLGLLGFITDIVNAIKNKTFSQTIELDSTANVDNLQVPVDLKFKFGK